MRNLSIILTGATGGIGQKVASELLRQGAELVIVGRNEKTLMQLQKALMQEYSDAGQRIHSVCEDISKSTGREALFHTLEETKVMPNVLVNNAGVSDFGLFKEQSDDTLEHLINVNVVAPMLLIKRYLGFVEDNIIDNAQVINIGSTFGSLAYPGFSAYSASKFALRGLTEGLSREYADRDVAFRYFAPRATQTQLNSSPVVAMNKALKVSMDDPEAVAAEFATFLSGRAQKKYVGWPEKLAARLNGFCPALIDKAISGNLATIRHYAKAS